MALSSTIFSYQSTASSVNILFHQHPVPSTTCFINICNQHPQHDRQAFATSSSNLMIIIMPCPEEAVGPAHSMVSTQCFPRTENERCLPSSTWDCLLVSMLSISFHPSNQSRSICSAPWLPKPKCSFSSSAQAPFSTACPIFYAMPI